MRKADRRHFLAGDAAAGAQVDDRVGIARVVKRGVVAGGGDAPDDHAEWDADRDADAGPGDGGLHLAAGGGLRGHGGDRLHGQRRGGDGHGQPVPDFAAVQRHERGERHQPDADQRDGGRERADQ